MDVAVGPGRDGPPRRCRHRFGRPRQPAGRSRRDARVRRVRTVPDRRPGHSGGGARPGGGRAVGPLGPDARDRVRGSRARPHDARRAAATHRRAQRVPGTDDLVRRDPHGTHGRRPDRLPRAPGRRARRDRDAGWPAGPRRAAGVRHRRAARSTAGGWSARQARPALARSSRDRQDAHGPVRRRPFRHPHRSSSSRAGGSG